MYYLYDNPWPLMIVLAAIGIVGFLSGSSSGTKVGAVCLLLAVAVFFAEKYLISPAERVELAAEEMLIHFKARDIDAIAAEISADKQHLTDIARRGLDLVDLGESFHIKSVDVSFDETGTTASAMLRANGPIMLRQHGGTQQYVPNFWKLIWVSEDGQWKLSEAIRLNPVNGERIDYFSAQ